MKQSVKFIAIACTLFSLTTLNSCGGNSHSKNTAESSVTETKEEAKSNDVSIGQVLKTDYFEITVNKVETSNKVNTGNQYLDLKQEAGSKYLILDVSIKNIDSESRMLTSGSVFIQYNGKDYEFDKDETVLADGWGLLLDQINPLITKKTKLVYKIPAEISGVGKWNPGRTNSDDIINLGDIK
jgi:hypothetical protein